MGSLLLSVFLIMNALAQGQIRNATDGSALVSEMAAAASGDRIMLTGSLYEISTNLTIKPGVKIIGQLPAHSSVIKLMPGGQIILDSNSEIWNCKITRETPTSGAPSISLATTTGGQNMRIENCFFEKNRTAIYINPGATNLQINKNKFEDNRTSIIVPDGGGDPITNLQITGNNIANNRTYGIIFIGNATFSIDATLTHNNITGNNVSAIGIDNNHVQTRIKVRNNWFGSPTPTTFGYSLNSSDAFSVQDHIEGFVDDDGFSFTGIVVGSPPFHISGINTAAIQGAASSIPPTINHASASVPDYSASFQPISIGANAFYTTIQDAVDNSADNDQINVPDGIYDEDVDINKAVKVLGESQENTIIRGLFTGNPNTVILGTNATISNLTVMRDYGNKFYEWTTSAKSQGITINGNGATIEGVKVTGNRNGIYINNRQNFTVKNNVIVSNRTGLQLVNNISGGQITNNIISENLTHGLMLNYDLGAINANNLIIKHNSFSGNWYSELYFNGSNTGTYSGADFTCNNFNTTLVKKLATPAGEESYAVQKPIEFGGSPPPTSANILRGTKINDLKHAPWLNIQPDADLVTSGFQISTQYTIEPVTGPLSPSNNNFRILANAIGCAVNDDQITLNGTFDYSESNALAEWAKGIDGDAATTGDNYAIQISRPLTGIRLSATALGAAKIQGPGDIPSANLESFVSLSGSNHSDWEISNLEISGFDVSIGYFNVNTLAHNTAIFNNKISIPLDLTDDANQNIGLHLTKGANQKIHHNTLYLDGEGVGIDFANKSSSIALQNYSSGAQHVNGLQIHDNEIIVTGQPSATEPAYLIGIWENSGGTNASVEIFNNKFSNADPGNLPQNNRQLAFRVTSRSGNNNDVIYHHNEISGFNRAIDWLGDPFNTYNPAAFNTNAKPVIVRNNKIDNVQYGITPRKSGASTNPNAPAIVEENQITNIADGGYAISYLDGGTLSATCNWFGFEPDETDKLAEINAVVAGTSANRTIIPYLYSGDNNATIGFDPTGTCSAPVKRVAPLEYFATIQEAINDAETQATHEIVVEPFTFHNTGQITVNKSVTIRGNNGDTSQKPKIAGVSGGTGANEARFNISVSNATIDNFEIEVDLTGPANTGIRAANTGGALTITNNLIKAIHSGQYPVWNSFGVDVGNQESGNFTDITMTGNNIEVFGRAARLTRTRGTVASNELKGIYSLNAGAYSVGGDLTIRENIFNGAVNMVESGSAGTDKLTIYDNTFNPILESEGKESLYLLQIRGNNNDKPVTISDNTFAGHKTFGIFIGRSGHVTIDHNIFNPSGNVFTNIAWNSKTETSSPSPAPYAADGFTVTNNALNGTGGTGISFANHNSGNGVVPLTNILLGSNGNENTFADNLTHYIVLDNQTGTSASLPLWNSGGFVGSVATTVAPFNVDFFVPYNLFGSLGLGNTMSYAQINSVEAKITDKDDFSPLGQVFIKAPVKNVNLGKFYLAIQPAIDEANTDHVIEVEPVTFDHATTILVNKSVYLKGISDPDAPRPILTGTGDINNKARFFITESDVIIENFEIRVKQADNDIVGIKAVNTGGKLTVTNNVITGLSTATYPVWNSFGIDVGDQESHSFTEIEMSGNTIGTFGRAARLTRTRGIVSGNSLTGIYSLNSGAYSVGGDLNVQNNQFFGAVNMVASGSATDNKLIVDDNDFTPILEAENRESFYLLQVRDNDNDKPAIVSNNRFNNHSNFGLFLGRSGNVTVTGNFFTPKASTTGFTHIAWNSKNESATTSTVAYAAEKITINGNTFSASGNIGGKAISFANHKSGVDVIPLKDITIGVSSLPNTFDAGIQHHIYLDKQSGSTNTEIVELWKSPAFGSAKESTMASFNIDIFAGYNLFGTHSSQAFNLSKDDIITLETQIHDKEDAAAVGEVFFRSVLNTSKGSHHATLQDAVNAADNTNELVAYGWEYPEDVEINKSVKITGSNLDDAEQRPLVQNSSGTQRFLITQPNVTLKNFRIEVSENGTDMTGIKTGVAGTYNNLILEDNHIINTNEGVWGSYGIFAGSLSPSNTQDQITLKGNNIQNFGRGARLERVYGTVEDNTFEGIYALNVAVYAAGGNLNMEDNRFYGSVSMVGSNTNTNTLNIIGNTFDAAQTDTNPFYLLQIRDNGNPTPVNISGNSFLNHESYGIFAGRSGNVTIDGNLFTPVGNSFTNIGWNSKSETSSGGAQPFAADGFTVINNTLNGSSVAGGTGVSFANHFGQTAVVPLTNLNLGTAGNPNTFGSNLAGYIVLDNQSANSNTIALWNSGAFAGAGTTPMIPFTVDVYAGNNDFGGSGLASTLGFTAIQTIETKVTDKDDVSTLGQVFFRTPVHNITQTKSYQTIQAALSEANPNDKIELDEWQYIESVTVATSSLSISGTGNTAQTVLRPATVCSGISSGSDGVTINTNDVILQNFTITHFRNGIVANGANITLDGIEAVANCYNGVSVRNGAHNLTVMDSKLNSNSYGIQLGTTVSANNMTIENAEIKANRIGLIVENGNGSGTTFNGARITNTDFSDSQEKGIYLEKANDLVMDGLLVNNCGTTTEQYLVNQGIDINLKYGTYSAITLRNSTITNSGASGHGTTNPNAPAAISIKARNDGSYAGNPATLTNVIVENNIIHGLVHGLRIGEYGTTANTGPTNVVIQNNAFTGTYTGKALINTTSAVPNANCNWWGVTTLSAIQAKTTGNILITTFLGNGNNTATGYGFVPSTACGAIRADFASSILANVASIIKDGSANVLITVTNVSTTSQTEDIVFSINKSEPNFTIGFDPDQLTINVFGTKTIQNSSEDLEVTEQANRYVFRIKNAANLNGTDTFRIGLTLTSNVNVGSKTDINCDIFSSTDDNIDNNNATVRIVSN